MPWSAAREHVQIDTQITAIPTPGVAKYVEKRIRSVLRFAHEPVLHARVRVLRHGDPAVAHPVTAQANLDLNGRLVRAQVSASTVEEAVDLLHDRLQQRLERLARYSETGRGRRVSGLPHEWRHGDVPTHRPPYFPRPAGERKIIRHKSFELGDCDLDEAAFDMACLDFDFHLFTERGTGQDSVLYRAGPTGYRLAQLEPHPDDLAPHTLTVTVSDQPAPVLTTTEAVDRMAAVNLPFLFYLDGERGRAAVLYRRYDGHYGLITPS
ncbi:ribosome-associated translation inhibitor RaiA [Saccharopolyspora phatthalungensis]|uniref:Ribosome-associated translation inhibitor RaiA n=2 Tax=Saccharopolyspora phatthalungensis TaxID=664693 RepID=A0A840QAU3_9PSEU|nr:ribosome-associated translation inhibitor RaiA [Saccharopolyspora phatthalungensis]